MSDSKNIALNWLGAYRSNRRGRKRDSFYSRTRIESEGKWISRDGNLWGSKDKAFIFDCEIDASNFIAACLHELPRACLHIIPESKDPLAQAIRKARRRGRKNALGLRNHQHGVTIFGGSCALDPIFPSPDIQGFFIPSPDNSRFLFSFLVRLTNKHQ